MIAIRQIHPAVSNRVAAMKLSNDSYVIFIGSTASGRSERYFRDKAGWVKVSMRGRTFRATAEQVLNHVLPALGGLKPGVTIRVEHQESDSTAVPPPHD